MLLLGGLCALSSCKNDDEAREEANASVVNIEKDAAPEMWTSEGDGSLPSEQNLKPEPPKEEVKEETFEPQPVQAEEIKQEEPKPQPKPEPKKETKSEQKSTEKPASSSSESQSN